MLVKNRPACRVRAQHPPISHEPLRSPTRRFDYSIPFLQWALTPPGFVKDWHVGVRSSKTGALMGMITGIPVHTRVYDKTMNMAEINFLCVHKKLR